MKQMRDLLCVKGFLSVFGERAIISTQALEKHIVCEMMNDGKCWMLFDGTKQLSCDSRVSSTVINQLVKLKSVRF